MVYWLDTASTPVGSVIDVLFTTSATDDQITKPSEFFSCQSLLAWVSAPSGLVANAVAVNVGVALMPVAPFSGAVMVGVLID